MLFSKKCDRLVGPLMESRLAFGAQMDVAQEIGVKVRYISDPLIALNERIFPKTHPAVRVRKHSNVIRRIQYWKRRYPAIPWFLRKRDANGAF